MPTPDPSVLITGATGAVGPRIVEVFHNAGFRVRTYSNEPLKTERFPIGTESVIGDINDYERLRGSMMGFQNVVHLAALLHENPRTPELAANYKHVNVRGTEKVVNACLATGISRLLFFSTISVYKANSGQLMTEESTTSPESLYAQTKLAAEKFVLNATRPDGFPLGTVLRLAAVYGSRVKGNYARLVKLLARKRFVPIGPGANRRSLIYDKDVVRAALLAMKHPAAAGRIYNVTDGQFHTVAQIIAAMCKALGRHQPHSRIPLGPVRLAARIAEKTKLLLGLSGSSLYTAVEKYIEDIPVDGRRIQEEIGFKPKYDLLSGWNETIEDMRARGDL